MRSNLLRSDVELLGCHISQRYKVHLAQTQHCPKKHHNYSEAWQGQHHAQRDLQQGEGIYKLFHILLVPGLDSGNCCRVQSREEIYLRFNLKIGMTAKTRQGLDGAVTRDSSVTQKDKNTHWHRTKGDEGYLRTIR